MTKRPGGIIRGVSLTIENCEQCDYSYWKGNCQMSLEYGNTFTTYDFRHTQIIKIISFISHKTPREPLVNVRFSYGYASKFDGVERCCFNTFRYGIKQTEEIRKKI